MRDGWFSASWKLRWSDDGTNLVLIIWIVLKCLSDPESPIHIEASKEPHFLIELEGADMTILPVLPHIPHR